MISLTLIDCEMQVVDKLEVIDDWAQLLDFN